MHDSPALAERLARGDTTVGVLSTITHPTLVEVFASAGVDFVWIDLEHMGPDPYDAERLENLSRAADVGGVDIVLRLPTTEPALVRKVLDTGIRNVLIPRIETAAEVRECVAAARFRYDGEMGDRGLAGVRANRWGDELGDYTERADRNVQVGVMLENSRAMENVDEILAVEDLGFAFLGPWDLSHSLGQPLDEDHPSVRDAMAELTAACAEADVPIMGFVDDHEDAAEKVDAGYQLLVIGNEVEAIRSEVGGWLETFDRRAGRTRADD